MKSNLTRSMMKSNLTRSIRTKQTSAVEITLPTPSPEPAPPIPPELNGATPVRSDDEDNQGFDEPSCKWKPLGRNDEDCGEGVICPPCG